MKKYLVALLLALLPSLASAQYDNANFIAKTYDLTATSYTYCTQFGGAAAPTCGTTTADGWVPTSNLRPIVIQVNWITKNATSLEYQVECKVSNDSATSPGVITTVSMTAVGVQSGTIWPHNWSHCRIGLKLTSDTGANSVSAWISNR
jgi:hypothetical protein